MAMSLLSSPRVTPQADAAAARTRAVSAARAARPDLCRVGGGTAMAGSSWWLGRDPPSPILWRASPLGKQRRLRNLWSFARAPRPRTLAGQFLALQVVLLLLVVAVT